jgi:hypothetical protein
VPASVTVPAGETTVDFPVTTHLVPASTTVTLQASAAGAVWSAALQLLHADLTGCNLILSRVTGGDYAQGTVTLNGDAPPGGAVITLTSDQPAAATAATVTVPAGGNQATFLIRTSPVAKPTTATITASYRGVSRSAALQIGAPALVQLQVNAVGVTGGASATGTIWISSPAPAAGLPVWFVSGDAAHLTVPAQILVPGGATSASFPITTRPVTAATLVPIWALGAQTIPAATLWVLPVGPSFTPTSVRGGRYAPGWIILPAPAPAGGTVVTLSSDHPAIVLPPARVTVPAGATTMTFAARTFAVATPITVTITASAGGMTWTRALPITP